MNAANEFMSKDADLTAKETENSAAHNIELAEASISIAEKDV